MQVELMSEQHPPLSQSKKVFLFAVTLVLAACSILYELVIAQTLSLLAANTVIWYSVTVGLYLLGMGVGSLLSKYIGNRDQGWNALICTELLLSLFGGLSVLLVNFGHMLFLYMYIWGYDSFGIITFFGIAFIATLIIGVLTGIELPLLIKMYGADDRTRSTAQLLGVDYIGSLVGAILFPTVLLPNLSLVTIAAFVALINVAVAALLVYRSFTPRTAAVFQSVACSLMLIFCGWSIVRAAEIEQYFLKRYYYYSTEISDSFAQYVTPGADLPEVFRVSSPYQKIDLVKEITEDISDHLLEAYSSKLSERENFPKKNVLFLNGDFQLNTSFDEVYHEYFAHVPIIATGRVPENILVLGGGDGLLIKELLKYDEVKQIEHIDLDRELIHTAKTHPVLVAANKRSLYDPRVSISFSDGYQYVRKTSEKFDAIYIDFPMPADYNLAKLYSREFFDFVGRRLTEKGFVTFDSTGTGMLTYPDFFGKQEVESELNDWPIYYHTLKAAGFPEIVPYVTTLETTNSKAADRIRELGIQNLMPPEGVALLRAARNSNEQKIVQRVLRRSLTKDLLTQHMMAMQQGFIMLANKPGIFSKEYVDFGVKHYVMNKRRFLSAFAVEFPKPEKVNNKLVNSILRPTFPTTRIWQPRVSF